MPAIVITDEDFSNILTPIGYPIVALEDLTDRKMTREDVESQLIFPAMREYFMFFPKTDTQEYAASGSFSVAFPDLETFTVLDARVVPRTVSSAGATTSPFMNEIFIRRADSFGYGAKYGTHNDYDFFGVQQERRAETQGMLEAYRTTRVRVNKANRSVDGYCTITGRLNIIWGKYSLDFSDIPFNFNWDVIKLAQSNVLQFFGELRRQSAAQLPTDVSGDNFIEKAKELRDEVLLRWKSYTKSVILRG